MTDSRRELRWTRPFASSREEAFLELQRSAALLQRDFTQLLRSVAPRGLRWTSTHYNILRILRGAAPQPLPCGDIGDRLVTPVPDVTRLLDRLCAAGLTARERDAEDRRVVRVGITEAGLELLARLEGPVNDWLERRLGHMPAEGLADLVRLLAEARRSFEEPATERPLDADNSSDQDPPDGEGR